MPPCVSRVRCLEVTGRGLEVDVDGRRLRVLEGVHTVFREGGR